MLFRCQNFLYFFSVWTRQTDGYLVAFSYQSNPLETENTMNTKNLTAAQIETAMRTRLTWIAEGNYRSLSEMEDDRKELTELATAYANLRK